MLKDMASKKSENKEFLDKADYESLAEFRYAVRKFLRFSESAAEAAGLTPNQHQALLAIKGFPGRNRITNGELAERLQIRHHSAVGLVNRLEAQNLVYREQSAADRREVYVALTDSGEELLERLAVVHRKELEHLAPQLSDILESLRRNID
jgi:DNA-binding MarR family transcriptional regulator